MSNQVKEFIDAFTLDCSAYSCTLAGGGSKYKENLEYYQKLADKGDRVAKLILKRVNEINQKIFESVS